MSLQVSYAEEQHCSMDELRAIAEYLASRPLTITYDEDIDRTEVLDTDAQYEVTAWEETQAGFAWFKVGDRTVLVGITNQHAGLMLHIPYLEAGVLDLTGNGPGYTLLVDRSNHEFITNTSEEEDEE